MDKNKVARFRAHGVYASK